MRGQLSRARRSLRVYGIDSGNTAAEEAVQEVSKLAR